MSANRETSSEANTNSRTDVGWKYCIALEGGTNKVQCKFCNKIMTAGITRGKEHLMGKKGKVAPCTQCPKEVIEELWTIFKEKSEKEKANFSIRQKSSGIDLGGLGFSDEEDGIAASNSPHQSHLQCSNSSRSGVKGPMDLFCKKPETAIEKRKKEKMRQLGIKEAVDKEAVARVHQYIARFWYQAGISFNAITLESFQDMVEAIGTYGRYLPAPTYHSIRVPLLNKELEYTNALIKGNKEEWSMHGCSIMSDGWTDRRQRTIINFLVNSPSGSVFWKSIDASNFVKTGAKIFELLDSVVEEIGEEKVVQVVTDNGSNYVAAGKMLMEKRKHLYWTPCAAHCLDLMLEDIGKLPLIKKTIQREVSLVGFIYNHSFTLSLLRGFTNKKELVRHAVTRFATSFLSLQRLYEEKVNLRKMFTSEEWVQNKLSKEAKGREATKTVLMPGFWKNVVFILKVMAPLVRVLRLVDGDKKPAMGYIYEAMDRAKETIEKSFQKNVDKYKEVFEIIDRRWNCQLHQPLHAAGHFLNPEIFYDRKQQLEYDLEVSNGLYACIQRMIPDKAEQDNIVMELSDYKKKKGLFGTDFAERQRKKLAPAKWWSMYGHSAPNLQRLAIRILSLTCSASGCERNWSVFEQIHSKKRNRLKHKKLHDLVYVKYNQKLHERHKHRDEIDPISLEEIDHCNEWLIGEMDEDRVFDDDTLDWNTVYEASGIGEDRTYTRRNSEKRKEVSGGASCARAKKSRSTPSTSRSKEPMLENEEELEDDFDIDDFMEEEEEPRHLIDESSDGEEGEGFSSLDYNEANDDDYVEIDEEE